MADYPNPEAWQLPGFSFEVLAGGARNTVLRGTGMGAAYVFKSTTRSEAQLAWLMHVKHAADRVGLRVALPLPTATGAFSHDGWTMERFVAGECATRDQLETIAPKLDAFHKQTLRMPQRPGFANARDLIQHNMGGDIDLTSMPPELVSQCRAAWALVPEQPACLIHGDVNPSNIIISEAGNPVLLDWDEARVDLATFDLLALEQRSDPVIRAGALAFEIAMCWCIETQRATALARDMPAALAAAHSWKRNTTE